MPLFNNGMAVFPYLQATPGSIVVEPERQYKPSIIKFPGYIPPGKNREKQNRF
jgi:hypothetical protein